MSASDDIIDYLMRVMKRNTEKTINAVKTTVTATGNGVIKSVVGVSKLFIKLVNSTKEVIKRDIETKRELKTEQERQNREWFQNLFTTLNANLNSIKISRDFCEEVDNPLVLQQQVDFSKQSFNKVKDLQVFFDEEYLNIINQIIKTQSVEYLTDKEIITLKENLANLSVIEARDEAETIALICAINGSECNVESLYNEAFNTLINKLKDFENFHNCKNQLLNVSQLEKEIVIKDNESDLTSVKLLGKRKIKI